MRYLFFLSLLLTLPLSAHFSGCPLVPPPLVSLEAGYVSAGEEHSGGLIQIEYKWGRYFWGWIRPGASLTTFRFHSLYAHVGLGIELYVTDHIVFCPNFGPGLYLQGSGKDLGFPLLFRSCLEIAYEMKNKMRLGFQFYHISNASLSDKNPGANAIAGYLAFPL